MNSPTPWALLAAGFLIGLCIFPRMSAAEMDDGSLSVTSEQESPNEQESPSLNDAIEYGRYLDQQWVSNYVLVLDKDVNQKIQEIGNGLVKASGGHPSPYTFRIVNSSQINAFATSGGFIYIHSGLLDIFREKDELAAVLAHELVHNKENHLLKRLRYQRFTQFTARAVGIVLGAFLGAIVHNMAPAPTFYNGGYSDADNLSKVSGFAGAMGEHIPLKVAEILVTGYSKDRELEADVHAVDYLKAAGYDPYAMIRLLKK